MLPEYNILFENGEEASVCFEFVDGSIQSKVYYDNHYVYSKLIIVSNLKPGIDPLQASLGSLIHRLGGREVVVSTTDRALVTESRRVS